MSVSAHPCIFDCIAHATVVISRLPDGALKSEFLTREMRETSFDVLDYTFKSLIFGNRQQDVKVIRHEDKFVQDEFSFTAIVLQRTDKEVGHPFRLQKRFAVDVDEVMK